MITDHLPRRPEPGDGSVIYVAGPVTGLPDHGRWIFAHVTLVLRQAGYTVISPIELGKIENGTFEQYLDRDLREGVAKSTALVLLPGWPFSRGAMSELNMSVVMGHPVGIWTDGYDALGSENVIWVHDFGGVQYAW
jgi:hypothetical protein